MRHPEGKGDSKSLLAAKNRRAHLQGKRKTFLCQNTGLLAKKGMVGE
jgi:hypothetical protein